MIVAGITLPVWAVITIAIVLASALISIVKGLSNLFGRISSSVAKAPGKGFRKLVNAVKGRKSIKEQSKIDKALIEADEKARLEAARQNPNYRNHPKVAKILKKREYVAIKKTLKDSKKSK